MTAESALHFDALEAQAERIMAVFSGAGYERVAPAILQPAGLLLDRVGEDIRARTYVFTDPDGQELCLRPDLTIPVCRVYLSRHKGENPAARYSYNGPAFRYQPGEPNPLRPREFRQAGIECFGVLARLDADMEILRLTAEAVRTAGLEKPVLKVGDIGLFAALIEALPMPDRWRQHLARAFWHGDALQEVLQRLTAPGTLVALGGLETLMAQIDPADQSGAEALILGYWEEKNITPVGNRTLAEIAERLMARKADASEKPLPPEVAKLLTDYLAISGSAPAAFERIHALTADAGIDLSGALNACEARLNRLGEAGFDAGEALFSADLGRRFEYYTGFVFELSAASRNIPAPVASGGRYDGLLSALGSGHEIPAVGAAIYTERLLAAAGKQTQ